KEDCGLLTISVTEDEILGIGGENIQGPYASMKDLQSRPHEQDEPFVSALNERWRADAVIADVTQAADLGPWLWKAAVEPAGSFHVAKVRADSPEFELTGAPEGYVRIHECHRLWSTGRIGEAQRDGQFKVVHETEELMQPDPFPAGYQ